MPLAILFANRQEQRDQLIQALWPVAESSQEEIMWIIVDPERYPEYASPVALAAGAWPAFAIEDQQRDSKYALPQRGSVADLNPAAIRRVVDDFVNKRLEGSKDLPASDKAEGDDVVAGEDQFAKLERLSHGAWKVSRDEL